MSDKNSSLMVDKYERAQTIMQGLVTKNLILNATIIPTWIERENSFWYIQETRKGKQYRLVNAETKVNKTAFDHGALASSLAKEVEQDVNAEDLPIHIVSIKLSPLQVEFTAFEKTWCFSEDGAFCNETDVLPSDWAISPDGKQAIFSREYNLWIKNVASGEEFPLTTDGHKDFAYGAYGTAWGVPPGGGGPAIQVLWSPDGKKILTAQLDRREVKETPFIHYAPQGGSNRPIVGAAKIAYPGDDHIETYRVVSINVEEREIQEAHYSQIPVTRSDWGLIYSNLAWWAPDSHRAYFVDLARDFKTVNVIEFDTSTGEVQVLIKETVSTQFNLMLNADERPTFIPLTKTNELLWFSERSGWAHLYLYDLDSGELKNSVTQGEWVVRDVVMFDESRREVFIQTGGRITDRDPYYRDLIRVNVDDGEITSIAASDHEYWVVSQKNFSLDVMKEFGLEINNDSCGVSPNGDFAVAIRSRADEAPVTLLYDRNGNEILEVEKSDISAFPDNWQWPEPVKLLAADGETDIYGLVYKPSDFSPQKSYPVIDYVFNTPEYPFVVKGSFTNGILLGMPYLDCLSLAELGFIVVQIDGRGLPFRSKSFQDESYGCIESVSHRDDHIAGIKQLAESRPYMDLERVGVNGSLCGGMGGTGAVESMVYRPEFYKVGVTGCLADPRSIAGQMWGEKWEGLIKQNSPSDLREEKVSQMEGKLLIQHGMLDLCTAPAAMFTLIEALYKANKDYDLVLLPNHGHDVDTYFLRRTWDYFVQHLLGISPPKEFALSTPFDKVTMGNHVN